jgi:hypothetical protein
MIALSEKVRFLHGQLLFGRDSVAGSKMGIAESEISDFSFPPFLA